MELMSISSKEDKYKQITRLYGNDYLSYVKSINKQGLRQELELFEVKTPAYLTINSLRNIYVLVLVDYSRKVVQ